MSAAPDGKGLGTIASSGLTPLLDTVFLLLFFFLAVAELPSAESAELVRVRLPAVEPAEGADDALPARLLLEIDRDSRVHLAASGGSIGSRDQLDRALERVLAGGRAAEAAVEIRADRDARHGVAVELLQHLRVRGFTDVRLVAAGAASAGDPFGGGTR